MTIQLFRKLFILLSVFSFLPGCIYENPQPCEEVSNMRFFYLLNPEDKDLFGESVNRIDVYIFDKDGIYIGKKSDSGPHIQNNYSMPIDLPDGVYTFVVTGYKSSFFNIGVFDPFKVNTKFDEGLITGQSTLENFRLKTAYIHNILFPTELQSLLRGNLIEREITKKELSVLDVFMIQYTNQIQISLKGLDTTGYKPVIYANNGRYDYENNIPVDAQDKIYNARISHGQTYSFDVLRLIMHKKMTFMLVDKNGIPMPGIKPVELIDEIQKSPAYKTQGELDKENVYRITLNYHQAVLVGVSVNGWSNIPVKPEV